MQALGLNNATIEFTLSTTEPTDVIYLTEDDAKRLGLAVARVPGPNRAIARDVEGGIGASLSASASSLREAA
jgi:hypothetical protein